MVGTLPAKWCITLVCFKSRAEVIPAVNNVIQYSAVTLDGGQDELINILNIIWIYISAVVHQQDKQLWYLASKSVQKRIVFNTSVHVITQAGSFISIFAATKVNRTLRQYFRSGGGGNLREFWVEVCRYWAARDLTLFEKKMLILLPFCRRNFFINSNHIILHTKSKENKKSSYFPNQLDVLWKRIVGSTHIDRSSLPFTLF